MNIVLFNIGELTSPLPRVDPRAGHIIGILKCREGSQFDAGQVNGYRGKATVVAITDTEITLDFELDTPASPPHPIDLVVGMTRPQTARDILRDATAMGVRSISFVTTEKSEKSYASSSLWQNDRYHSFLIDGASTAFTTFLPNVFFHDSVVTFLSTQRGKSAGIVLDNYEATGPLSSVAADTINAGVSLVIGAERGWTDGERNAFRDSGFAMAHIGERVLRTEVATVAAIAILLDAMSRDTKTPSR